MFDLTLDLRDTFYSAIGSENPLEYDLIIYLQEEGFKQLKVINNTQYYVNATIFLCKKSIPADQYLH